MHQQDEFDRQDADWIDMEDLDEEATESPLPNINDNSLRDWITSPWSKE